MDIDAIKARLEAATPGPWHWSGNVDHGDPSLESRHGSLGKTVIRMLRIERRKDDPRIRPGDLLDVLEPRQAVEVRRNFLFDEYGEPRSDYRMSFRTDDHMTEARSLAVFEVCREATERSDRRVYRADVVDIRNPDAQLIAHAPEDIATLIGEVDRLRSALEEIANDTRLGPGWIAALVRKTLTLPQVEGHIS